MSSAFADLGCAGEEQIAELVVDHIDEFVFPELFSGGREPMSSDTSPACCSARAV